DLCIAILKIQPDVKILGLSSSNHPVQINQLMTNGAKGYLLKTTNPSEIAEAIRQVFNGNIFICKEAGNILFSKSVIHSTALRLTKRELEILKLLAERMTAPKLAEKLHLSQLTVESHRRNIMAKLKVKNTAMLIRVAVDNNLI